MGRPKKIEAPQPNTPQENMTNMMLRDSLSRYEKTMTEFIPLLQQLIERINILINKPVVQTVTSEPVILSTPFNISSPMPDSASPPMSDITSSMPQITNDLSERQIWYFSSGGGSNIPTEFIKQQYSKDKWQDLTRLQAIELIGEWKQRGEK